jgi:lipopolysaccharide export system permease protein
MTLFGRYVFRQALNAFLMILLTLTAIVWLATALKQLDLITSQGQGFLIFFEMTLLSLPSLISLIAPNAMLMAALYTLDRMNGDSEIIVMTAAGGTIWRVGTSLLALAAIVSVGILLMNLYVMPASMRELRVLITEVRTDLISQVLEPGRFTSPEDGLTFHIRDRAPNGDLLGLLVEDERDPTAEMTYLAERGRIISSGANAYLVMFDGQVQRYNAEQPQKGAQIVAFDRYVLDITAFDPQDSEGSVLDPNERYLSELLHPSPQDLAKLNPGLLRSELHQRFSTPLYPLLFVMLAVCLLGHARTTRQDRWGQIFLVFGIAVLFRVIGISMTNLTTLDPWAAIPVYAVPLAAILIAAGAAHVRMAPELRAKLSLDVKFKPANIKYWVARGIKAK